MSDVYKRAEDLFEKELDKIVMKDNLTPAELELCYKIVDIIKDIHEICGGKDNSYDNGYSEAMYPYRRSRMSPMQAKLQRLYDEAGNEQERMMVRSWMSDLSN